MMNQKRHVHMTNIGQKRKNRPKNLYNDPPNVGITYKVKHDI